MATKAMGHKIALASALALMSCKAKVKTKESDVASDIAGPISGERCQTIHAFHKRLYKVVDILTDEFMRSCFNPGEVSLAGKKPKPWPRNKNIDRSAEFFSPDSSIWNVQQLANQGKKITPHSIFRYEEFSEDVFNAMVNAASPLRGNPVEDYVFVPQIYWPGKGGGKLGWMDILGGLKGAVRTVKEGDQGFSLASEMTQRQFERQKVARDLSRRRRRQTTPRKQPARQRTWTITSNESQDQGVHAFAKFDRLAWKHPLSSFSPSCKSQITAIKDRLRRMVEISRTFEDKNCCSQPRMGGSLITGKPTLTCDNGWEASHQPLPAEKGLPPYHELSNCGGKRQACTWENFSPKELKAGATCIRCELRISPGQRSINYVVQPLIRPPGSKLGYNHTASRLSGFTCRSAAAARSAVATHCINSAAGPCKALEYSTDIGEVYRKINPYLHCYNASPWSDRLALRNESEGNPGDFRFIDYGKSESIAGGADWGFSGGAAVGILKFSSDRKWSASSSTAVNAVTQIRSPGNLPIHVERDGRIEFNAASGLFCSETVGHSRCKAKTGNLGVRYGLPQELFKKLPLAGASATTTFSGSASLSNCESYGSMEASNWGELPRVGGLSLEQASLTCAERRTIKTTSAIKYANGYTEAIRLAFNAGKTFLPSMLAGHADKIAPTGGSEFFTLDLIRKNLFCAKRGAAIRESIGTILDDRFTAKGQAREDDPSRVFAKKGFRIHSIYLRALPGAQGNTVYQIGAREAGNSPTKFDERTYIRGYTHSAFEPLMNPGVSNEQILNYVHGYLQTDRGERPTGIIKKPLDIRDYICRILPELDQVYEFEHPATCLISRRDGKPFSPDEQEEAQPSPDQESSTHEIKGADVGRLVSLPVSRIIVAVDDKFMSVQVEPPSKYFDGLKMSKDHAQEWYDRRIEGEIDHSDALGLLDFAGHVIKNYQISCAVNPSGRR